MGAFEQVYEQTKQFVYNVIYRMTRNAEETYDLTHDVFVKVFHKRKAFKPTANIKTWIYRIAVNHTLNHVKKQNWLLARQGQIQLFYKQQLPSASVDTEDVLVKLLEKLPAKYRMPIVLKDLEERSYEEIAEILNLNSGTLKSRLNRGRAKLLEAYQKEVGHGKQG